MYATPADVLAAADIVSSTPVRLDVNGCALWPDWIGANGYGYFKPVPRKLICVHRAVYVATVDAIPDGWHVDHVWMRGCRSRACFWPGHLEAVTPAENARRAGRATRERRERACGHPWDHERSGRGDCADCHREDERLRKAPARAANADRWKLRTATILQLLAAGESRSEVARAVGCSVETVRRTELSLGKKY